MELSIVPHEDGTYWVSYGTKWTGPFANVRDASSVVCEIISDRAKELHGNKVYFMEGQWKV